MARDTSPIVKQSRREGVALHPKAHKILARKSGIPGEHAHGRQGKQSMYSQQLREKQKVRRMYGLLEKQFAKLMNEATRKPGLSGENLLRFLELRLNGRRVDIPSIRVKAGDVITVRPKSTKSGYFTAINDIFGNTTQAPLSWLKGDIKKLKIEITSEPKREEAEAGINEQLIVEYYSR